MVHSFGIDLDTPSPVLIQHNPREGSSFQESGSAANGPHGKSPSVPCATIFDLPFKVLPILPRDMPTLTSPPSRNHTLPSGLYKTYCLCIPLALPRNAPFFKLLMSAYSSEALEEKPVIKRFQEQRLVPVKDPTEACFPITKGIK